MRLERTNVSEVIVVNLEIVEDNLGYVIEPFDDLVFQSAVQMLGQMIPKSFVYESCSMTRKGEVRGIHYQCAPELQARLVQIVKGSALHVVIDMRASSSTFGESISIMLKDTDQKQLWIPEGFAHGFLALEDCTQIRSRCTAPDSQACLKTIFWDDPRLALYKSGINPDISVDLNLASDCLKGVASSEAVRIHSEVDSINFRVIGDHRGSLVAIEGGRTIPFEIKRVYYIFDTISGVGRGYHAHRNLKQLAVCVSGSCRMVVDDGVVRKSIFLDNPGEGILISNLIWREMHEFSDDCVLMVLASARYDEADYIRDYDVFLSEVENAKK